jgi:hypothetical protein
MQPEQMLADLAQRARNMQQRYGDVFSDVFGANTPPVSSDYLPAGPHVTAERYVTGTGQNMGQVHPVGFCDPTFCVIHRPVPGPWDTWKTHWVARDPNNPQDPLPRLLPGVMTRVCEHNVAHIAVEEVLRLPTLGFIEHQHPPFCSCPCSLDKVDEVLDEHGEIKGFKLK